jgi:hypothetical protein
VGRNTDRAYEMMRASRQACKNCSGPMGLGIISAKVYIPDKWWWSAYRFCSKRCRDQFFRNNAEEFRRPSEAIHTKP